MLFFSRSDCVLMCGYRDTQRKNENSKHGSLLSGEPDKASVLNLLGHSARAQKRHRHAIKHFKESLELNPFLWEAFENLCELGEPPDPNDMFSTFSARTGITGLNNGLNSRGSILSKQRSRTLGNENPFGSSTIQGTALDGNIDKPSFSLNKPSDFVLSKQNFATPMPPDNRALALTATQSPAGDDPDDFVDKTPTPSNSSNNFANPPPSTAAPLTGTTERVPLKRGASIAKRTYDRTKSASALTGLTNKRRLERSATTLNLGVEMRGSNALQKFLLASDLNNKTNEEKERENKDALPKRTEAELWQESVALQSMADIFRIMARAYGSFAIHKFADAITQCNSLPFAHLNSGWVQCQIAKCKMEMADYEEAEKHFELARTLEPSMHKDMDVYSSCLWHLKKETALSTLAKDLKDANSQSHVAWVALGNAYNLRQEHEQALSCFQRAIQLNDQYAYAHTLSGQEYFALEEHDKAQAEYQLAMTINPRHYFAWYGMGQIYSKMGKNDLSLVYYQEAQKLNPSNAVLLYLVGTIQEKLDRAPDARLSFERAIKINPTNVVARYRLAKLLADMGFMNEAIDELELIKNLAPNEPKVYMLQGKILDKMGNKEEALKYLTWALDLDTKSSHEIQGLIDKVHKGSEEQELNYDYIMDE
ncbi:anaphase-promoting complex subunit cdc27 [Haplosporangium bisporale]|nr:anaphase-promoting complex subunit cdc27 [Haplosporangium bisporale]